MCAGVGRVIAGRAPGVHLDDTGRSQCRALAGRVAAVPLRAVYTSPLERARETAEAVAEPHGLTPVEHAGLVELDFGDWTGRSIAELESDPRWRRFNSFRSGTRIPGGEMMLEAQARAVAALDEIASRHRGGEHVAMVSHGDVIRAVLLLYLGMSLDHVHRLEITPASVSTVDLYEDGVVVREIGTAG